MQYKDYCVHGGNFLENGLQRDNLPKVDLSESDLSATCLPEKVFSLPRRKFFARGRCLFMGKVQVVRIEALYPQCYLASTHLLRTGFQLPEWFCFSIKCVMNRARESNSHIGDL